jgi:hypothetical protein
MSRTKQEKHGRIQFDQFGNKLSKYCLIKYGMMKKITNSVFSLILLSAMAMHVQAQTNIAPLATTIASTSNTCPS